MINKVLFSSDKKIPSDEEAKMLLNKISKLPFVNSVVGLPDFHMKKNMEAPSSIAVGVEKHIIPHLSSCSLNCGMGMITTELVMDDVFTERVGEFYNNLRNERDNRKYNITREELDDILYEGVNALKGKYNVQDSIINGFENKGQISNSGKYSIDDCSRIVPVDLIEHPVYNGRSDLGVGFGGNHFLEMQKVTEILDEEVCLKNNIINPGQIVIMYHGGGGIIPGFIGGYFSRRLKGYTNSISLILNKIKYHLPRLNSLDSLLHMYEYYLSPRRFVSVPEGSSEGQRLVLANNMAMNYGYAYRMFMILRIQDALKAVFGHDKSKTSLFKDISHNSIQKEIINGQEMWIHRHNSCRIEENALTVLPGFNNTSSYVCMGMNNTAAFLNTIPHGAGASIKEYIRSGFSQTINGRKTMVYRKESKRPEIISHYSDEGIDAVINQLETKRILRPIARLTPVAVLKDYR